MEELHSVSIALDQHLIAQAGNFARSAIVEPEMRICFCRLGDPADFVRRRSGARSSRHAIPIAQREPRHRRAAIAADQSALTPDEYRDRLVMVLGIGAPHGVLTDVELLGHRNQLFELRPSRFAQSRAEQGIAAEKTGRSARLIEYDPIYCDTIVRRWEMLTGKQATLVGTDQTFEQVAEDRQGMGSIRSEAAE